MELTEKRPIFKAAAIISYIIGFIYIKYMVLGAGVCDTKWFYIDYGVRFLAFAVIFLVCTEIFAYKLGITYDNLKERKLTYIEPIIYLVCVILQSVAMAIWGYHDDWEIEQILFWHFTIIYYVMARTGALAAGRSGILFLLDCFQGFFTIPFFNIFMRAALIFKRKETLDEDGNVIPKKKISAKSVCILLTTLFIAMVTCYFAIYELGSASSTFGGIVETLSNDIDEFFETEFIDYIRENVIYFLVSIPVSWYLFSLVAGALKQNKPYCSDEKFETETQPFHQLPAYSAYIVIGSVCFIYTLFLGTAIYDFINHKGLFAETAHEASVRAVGSFWSLIRVVLLNFAIMAGSCVCSKKALWEETATRILGTVLFVFAFCFAILAACNLIGVYIAIFGVTPRRILSSWVVMNVIFWCILMIIRFYKKISAAQIAIVTAAVSFSVLVLFKF